MLTCLTVNHGLNPPLLANPMPPFEAILHTAAGAAPLES